MNDCYMEILDAVKCQNKDDQETLFNILKYFHKVSTHKELIEKLKPCAVIKSEENMAIELVNSIVDFFKDADVINDCVQYLMKNTEDNRLEEQLVSWLRDNNRCYHCGKKKELLHSENHCPEFEDCTVEYYSEYCCKECDGLR